MTSGDKQELRDAVSRALAGFWPLLQILTLGRSDYRRAADVAVVLGARVYADGRLSEAVGDRVRTAVELYREGWVGGLIMSGGPGDGAIHDLLLSFGTAGEPVGHNDYPPGGWTGIPTPIPNPIPCSSTRSSIPRSMPSWPARGIIRAS